ncbi:MAG: fumarylacetoacetate hydrolase family protein [Gammaproteobacteria bacterium]|nr:fumarylacetoacetate hydrolase family protein [Gammaproteobacteria bacterium]
MKLASLKSGRDGQLVVVSRDLKKAVVATGIAHTLQHALDHWNKTEPQLQALYAQLNQGQCADLFDFDETQCASPLPRTFHWVDGSAYVTHVELVRQARGDTLPENFWHDPLVYQGGGDTLIGPRDDIQVIDPDWGIDLEAEVAIITDDVPMGTTPEQARKHIKLILLVNDVTLRNLTANELKKGFGFYQSKPSSAFSPVAVTPDELGTAWDGARVHLPLHAYVNEKLLGQPNAGEDMVFDFPTLLAHVAKTRNMCAGAILGSGTISNKDKVKMGSCCLVEVRMLETIEFGEPKTPYLKYGDTIRIEMLNAKGESIFGSIAQTVRPYV